jgi:hypothetical protein
MAKSCYQQMPVNRWLKTFIGAVTLLVNVNDRITINLINIPLYFCSVNHGKQVESIKKKKKRL